MAGGAPARAALRLRLARFRSWSALQLEIPDGASVALTGPNGAGKTNLLEALSLLAPGRGLRGASPEEFARRPERAGWAVEALWRAPEIEADSAELRVGADPEGRRLARIDGRELGRSALGAPARLVWLTPALDRLFLESPGDRRRFWDRLTLAFVPEHGERALAYERAMRERNRLLEDPRADSRWLDALEDEMARAGTALSSARMETLRRLSAAAEEASEDFPVARLNLTGLPEAALAEGFSPEETEAAFRRRLAEGRPRDAAARRALIGPHRMDLEAVYVGKETPAALCSTGEQKALLVGMILAHARALAEFDDAPPVLLLDEISAHFDAGRRAALFQALADLGAQVWMTGAEMRLFEAAPPGTLRLSVRETLEGSVLEG
ncbi:DNA replication/repair protein RecF [Neomegalonema sp.]|uniref:DNA replication/repair protein RecF n=1 Tax=Neomegalonema sp. TaxID=2039713 RepID=UPI0026204A4C|nr:DNA replication/repair protein RecF [Neomegalonema sp.]MDD2867223.1 DNA replication/repair protein RecF [Neomegalonema sp.]